MRTTFCEMHLFNDTSQKLYTSFTLNGKEWGKSKTEGERGVREQVKSESQNVVEKGLRRGALTLPLVKH